jgi:hypothetical protein
MAAFRGGRPKVVQPGMSCTVLPGHLDSPGSDASGRTCLHVNLLHIAILIEQPFNLSLLVKKWTFQAMDSTGYGGQFL